jgi:hypothetical protein
VQVPPIASQAWTRSAAHGAAPPVLLLLLVASPLLVVAAVPPPTLEPVEPVEPDVPPPAPVAEPTDPLAAGSIPKIALHPPRSAGASQKSHSNAVRRETMK